MTQQTATTMNRRSLSLPLAIELADIDHQAWGLEPDIDPPATVNVRRLQDLLSNSTEHEDFPGIQAIRDDVVCDPMDILKYLPGPNHDPFPGGVGEQADKLRSLLESLGHRLGTRWGDCRVNQLQGLVASDTAGDKSAEIQLRGLSPIGVSMVSPASFLDYVFGDGEYVFLATGESAPGRAYPVSGIEDEPILNTSATYLK